MLEFVSLRGSEELCILSELLSTASHKLHHNAFFHFTFGKN